MKVKFISTVLGLLLVVGAGIVLPTQDAEAHNFDNNSTYLCTALKPDGHVLIHSWPVAWGTGWVRYWCMIDFYGVSHQYWIEWNQDNGRAYRITAFQKCNQGPQGGTVWCGIAAHPV